MLGCALMPTLMLHTSKLSATKGVLLDDKEVAALDVSSI